MYNVDKRIFKRREDQKLAFSLSVFENNPEVLILVEALVGDVCIDKRRLSNNVRQRIVDDKIVVGRHPRFAHRTRRFVHEPCVDTIEAKRVLATLCHRSIDVNRVVANDTDVVFFDTFGDRLNLVVDDINSVVDEFDLVCTLLICFEYHLVDDRQVQMYVGQLFFILVNQ